MTEPLRIPTERVTLRELTIDMRKVKPAVQKEVEERLTEPLQVAHRKGRIAEIIWAYAYAVGRRIDPYLTWEEAGEIEVSLITDTAIPPTDGNG